MKNRLFPIAIIILGVSLPLFTARALVVADPAVEGATATDEQVDLQNLKDQPLEVRRQVISTQLYDILTKLNVLYDKTKLAMDRLTANGIDTTKAQAELALVAQSLAASKTNIDIFADQTATVKATPAQPTPLRDAVLKAETSLRDSRQHIINTLLSLKAAIPSAPQQ